MHKKIIQLRCDIQNNTIARGGVLPYMGYEGMRGPKTYSFPAILVIHVKRQLILANFVLNRVWFYHSSLVLGMFLRRSYFFIIISKTINRSSLCLGQLINCPSHNGHKKGIYFWPCHKYGTKNYT